MFQYTAARRRLEERHRKLRAFMVSIHSRPKAAGMMTVVVNEMG